MDNSDKGFLLIKALESIEEDWLQTIFISREYFRYLSFEYNTKKVIMPMNWPEMKDAWLELKMFEDLHDYYKKMLGKGQVDEALVFAERVLNNVHMAELASNKLYKTLVEETPN